MTHRHALRLPAVTSLATVGLVTSLAAQVATTPAGAPYPPPRGPHPVAVERSVMVPMRDGVKLATDIYRPADVTGPLPTILMRTPYNKQGSARRRKHLRVERLRRRRAGRPRQVRLRGRVQGLRGRHDRLVRRVRLDRRSSRGATSASAASAAPTWASSRSSPRSSVTRCTSPRFRRPRAATWAASDGIARSGDRSRAARTRCRSTSAGCRCGRRSTRASGRGPKVDFATFLRTPPAHRHDRPRRVAVVGLAQLPRALARRSVVGQAGLPHRRRQRERRRAARVVVVRHGRRGARGARDLREERRRTRARATNQYAIISPTTHCASERASSQTMAGELDVGDARLHYWDMYLAWFDHWLRGNEHAIDSMPRIQYYTIGRNEVAEVRPLAGRRHERDVVLPAQRRRREHERRATDA